MLRLVDWDILAIYTCVNPDCFPENHYQEEFGYVAFSDDFSQVKLGTPEQIAAAKKKQREEMAQLDEVEQEEMKKLELEEMAKLN